MGELYFSGRQLVLGWQFRALTDVCTLPDINERCSPSLILGQYVFVIARIPGSGSNES